MDVLLLLLLVAEGCVLTCLAAAYVARLLRRVSAQRYSLASCFINIPTGFVRALASKQVALDDDEENDSDSEAGDEPEQQVQTETGEGGGGAGAHNAQLENTACIF